jgi:peroxiredoxin
MMKKELLILVLSLCLVFNVLGQRIEVFQLPDMISGNEFNMAEQQGAKAVVLIFTSLSCPFSKLYEDRISELNSIYSPDGFVFVLIHPQVGQDDEQIDAIRAKVTEKKWTMPFLNDSKQEVTRQFKITKLPEVVVAVPSPTGFALAYRGAIDNNPQMASNANIRYLDSALQAIQNRRNPSPASSRPVGCNIRTGF